MNTPSTVRRLACTILVICACAAIAAPIHPKFWVSPGFGIADFWQSFRTPGAWDSVASRIDAFSIHVNALTARDTARLIDAAAFLNDRHIKVTVECGGLRPFSGCDSMAGEHHAVTELTNLNIWKRCGGRVDYIAMDSPINTMIAVGDPSGNCGWTVEHAANEMVDYMLAVRAVFPEVSFGLIEPVPWYSVGTFPNHPGNHYGDLLLVLDTVRAVVAARGEHLDFFLADSPYEYSANSATDGWHKLKAVQDHVRALEMEFGLIYNERLRLLRTHARRVPAVRGGRRQSRYLRHLLLVHAPRNRDSGNRAVYVYVHSATVHAVLQHAASNTDHS
jgi:hypothetical protein